MRKHLAFFTACWACLLALSAHGAIILEARLQPAEERSRPFGVLYLEVSGSEVRYNFWADPAFEAPGALRIEGGNTVRSLHLGEGQMVRFDYNSFGGNHIPENPFLRQVTIDGSPEWLSVEGMLPEISDWLTNPALSQWMEYSGAIDDSELAVFLGTESGLSAMMGALFIREIDGTVVFASFSEGRGELTAVPEPAVVGLLVGGFAFLSVFVFRRMISRRKLFGC